MRELFPTVIGIPALIGFGMHTSWQAAVLLFLVLFANNVSQTIVREHEAKGATDGR